MRIVTYILSVTVFLIIIQCRGNQGNKPVVMQADTGKAEIIFTDYEHHFGKIAEGEKVSWQFRFVNKGTGDLVISQVLSTCGCTVTKYDVRPIPPGEEGTIEVVFDSSGRNGMQTKTITIRSNARVQVVILKITAEVEQKQLSKNN